MVASLNVLISKEELINTRTESVNIITKLNGGNGKTIPITKQTLNLVKGKMLMMKVKKIVPSEERMESRYGSTWSSHQLGLCRSNDYKLYCFVDKNRNKLKRMKKDQAIKLMKNNCSYDTSDIKSFYISKRDLNKIIDID